MISLGSFSNTISNILVSVGLLVNVVAFLVWVFGPKSKVVCCAVYFAANAVADTLLLAVRHDRFWTHYYTYHTYKRSYKYGQKDVFIDVLLVLNPFLYRASLQLSTWISAIITVERSFTILWPFVFKSQTMRRRSVFVIFGIVLLQPLTQYHSLYNVEVWIGKAQLQAMSKFPKVDIELMAHNQEVNNNVDHFVGFLILTLLVPFFVIVVFNAATVFTLCRNRMRRNTVSGTRDYASVFTKLTLITGVSFVMAFTPIILHDSFRFNKNTGDYPGLYYVGRSMQLFNSLMNPVICFIVCKGARDDIKQFLRCVAHKIRCTCRRPGFAASRIDQNPENIALEQIVSTNAGTSEQVVPVNGFTVKEAVSVNVCTVEEEEVSVNFCAVGEENAVNVGTPGTMEQDVCAITGTTEQDVSDNAGTTDQDMSDNPRTMKQDVYAITGTTEQNVSDNPGTFEQDVCASVGKEVSVSAGIMLNDASTPM